MNPKSNEIRLLKTGHNSCYWNMALDEVLMKSVRNNAANTPMLRIFSKHGP